MLVKQINYRSLANEKPLALNREITSNRDTERESLQRLEVIVLNMFSSNSSIVIVPSMQMCTQNKIKVNNVIKI